MVGNKVDINVSEMNENEEKVWKNVYKKEKTEMKEGEKVQGKNLTYPPTPSKGVKQTIAYAKNVEENFERN